MKVLLDTSTFIWMAFRSHRLSKAAKAALYDPENELYLSSVSSWEIVSKYAAGKLDLESPAEQMISGVRAELVVQELPFTDRDAFQSRTLPNLHSDPFDRMLICQAITNGCAIVTPDQAIAQYSVHTIW